MKHTLAILTLFFLIFSISPARAIGPYTDNGDGTVTDNNTGLVWMQNTADTNGDNSITSDDRLSWRDAFDYCPELGNGWREPSFDELKNLVDKTSFNPAIDSHFQCESDDYWVANISAIRWGYAPVVDFRNGQDHLEYGRSSNYVRCVRDGPSGGSQTVNLPAGSTPVLAPYDGDFHEFGVLESLEHYVSFRPDQETFVIVHGWNPDHNVLEIPADSWVRKMGQDIVSATNVGGGNVLLWDWMEQARDDHNNSCNLVQKVRGVPYSRVPDSGKNLAISLNNYLPANYSGKIHLIGHSLGSGVILYAAKRFKEVYHRSNIKQLTLLDSPWVGHYPAGKFLKRHKDELFVDNYRTMFGRPQGYGYADVNVDIGVIQPVHDLSDLVNFSFRHQYAHLWYRSSITNFQDKTILNDSTVPGRQMKYGFYWHTHHSNIPKRWIGPGSPAWSLEQAPVSVLYGHLVSTGHHLRDLGRQTRDELRQFAHDTGTDVKILAANGFNKLQDIQSWFTDQAEHAQWVLQDAQESGALVLILNSEAVVSTEMDIDSEVNSFQFNYEFPTGTDPQTRFEVFFDDIPVYTVKTADVSIGVEQQSPWIDISALAGKHTALTFRLSNPVDGPLGKIKMDDLVFARLTPKSAKFPWPMFLPAISAH